MGTGFMNRNFHLISGLIALLLAFLSLYDMSRTQLYDGITPGITRDGVLVQDVAHGSPAERAGIRRGDLLLGVAHTLVKQPFTIQELLLNAKKGGIPYLLQRGEDTLTFFISPEQKRAIKPFHIFAGLLMTLFFLIGLIVLLNNPMGGESRLFYYLTMALMLLFTCFLRPHSYTLSHLVIRSVGQLAYVLLPAFFLHFFLIYPIKSPIQKRWYYLTWLLYVIPVALLFFNFFYTYATGIPMQFDWQWVLYLAYSGATLAVLYFSGRRAQPSEKNGLLRIYSLGMLPFVLVGIPMGIVRNQADIASILSAPMVLIPVYLSYRIYRFGFFNIRILLKKSLMYSFILLLASVLYAILLFLINNTLSNYDLTDPYLYSMGLAVAIVFLFNPLHSFLQTQLEDVFLEKEKLRRQDISARAEQMLTARDQEELDGRVVRLMGEIIPDRFAILVHSENNCFYDIESERLITLTDQPGKSSFFLLENSLDSEFYPFYQKGLRIGFPFRKANHIRAFVLTRSVLFEEELEIVRRILLHFVTAHENARLLARLSQQIEMERDIKIAGFIQKSLIPSIHPDNSMFRVYGVSVPSRVIGGDFFDYFSVSGSNRTGILIGDVAGKSIPAALMMVAAKETISSQATSLKIPEEIMSRASELLVEKSSANMFVAACYCCINKNEKRVSVVNAGMPSPYLVRD
ncbi:MAG: SpoIIE family protein phosphatase, partial [Acidobacteria bacterium]|nr:SpoIIE family protein phosphatase [Acidobacteriota bacterium]